MARKRIGRHLEGGPVPGDELDRRVRQDALRGVFARWASGVSIVAVQDDSTVHALTVSAFMPLSVEPPLILVGLGPNASILPFLDPGVTFTVSFLQADQRGLASRFADVFPVGPSPFTANAQPPIVVGCLAALVCTVEEIRPGGDHQLVIGRVTEALEGEDRPGLAYFRRNYHPVGTSAD